MDRWQRLRFQLLRALAGDSMVVINATVYGKLYGRGPGMILLGNKFAGIEDDPMPAEDALIIANPPLHIQKLIDEWRIAHGETEGVQSAAA